MRKIIESNRYKLDWSDEKVQDYLYKVEIMIDNHYNQITVENRTILFPNRVSMNLKDGMKSGCNLTSLDNSIIHNVILHDIREDGTEFVVYGDDNISFNKTRKGLEEYATKMQTRIGEQLMIIKPETEGVKTLKTVDYLSKKIKLIKRKGENIFVPYRETWESMLRIAKPDTYLLDWTGINGDVQRLERLFGHLIDNWNNDEAKNHILREIDYYFSKLARSKKDFGYVVRLSYKKYQFIHGLFDEKKDFTVRIRDFKQTIEELYFGVNEEDEIIVFNEKVKILEIESFSTITTY